MKSSSAERGRHRDERGGESESERYELEPMALKSSGRYEF
jgi:hypothetical protein